MTDKNARLLNVKRVVIWGYPKDTHTHSYIHEAFYKAFKFLGYDTYWFNNTIDVSNFNFSDTLFLTSGSEECLKIPIRKDGLYILHNCPRDVFITVLDRIVNIQVLTDPVYNLEGTTKINDYTIIEGSAIYQPWATDLLPNEINFEWANLKRKNIVNYVGSVLDGGYNDVRSQLIGFSEGCRSDGIEVHAYGGYTPGTDIGYLKRHANFITNDQHVELIKESIYAPQLCSIPQVEMGYIPCRIFKNISYGHTGITNSKAVNRVFNECLIYDENTYTLYCKAKEGASPKKAIELMKLVKDKHTYINRINSILELFR
jgi:hypothetical protein